MATNGLDNVLDNALDTPTEVSPYGDDVEVVAPTDPSATGDDASKDDGTYSSIVFHSVPPPSKVFRILLISYCAVFALHRLADLMYYFSVGAKFPASLDYRYSSDLERQSTVSYIKQSLSISMLGSAFTFALVLALVCSNTLADFDFVLRACIVRCKELLEMIPSWLLCPCRCLGGLCSTLGRWTCNICCCCCRPCAWCLGGFKPRWGEAFHGAIYLMLFGIIFSLVSIPFKIWMYDVNISFGFTNTLTTSAAQYRNGLIKDMLSPQSLITGIPSMMLYLVVLQSRFGWLLMWLALILVTIIGQFNISSLAGMIFDASTTFPAADFFVGNDFPIVGATHNVSLNRIYYAENDSEFYSTKDKSKGNVELANLANGVDSASKLVLREYNASTPTEYAKILSDVTVADEPSVLQSLSSQAWVIESVSAVQDRHEAATPAPTPAGQIAVRHGSELRAALLDFAHDHGIHISQVYMIDGSYKDVRANAFAAGAGKNRIIGLYDTLFLGDSSEVVDESAGAPDELMSIRHLGKKLRGVDAENLKRQHLRRSKPTKAMTDQEILAIMGHELGHSALHHAEQGMVLEAFTSFLTFALLGGMVHFPAAFGLSLPVAHVAVFMYQKVATPALDGILDLVNDAVSRHNEYAADAYSARVSESYAIGLQTALEKLTVNSNADPNEPWFYEMFYDDHPTTAKRCAQVKAISKHRYGRNSSAALTEKNNSAEEEPVEDMDLNLHVTGSEMKRRNFLSRG